MSDLYVFLYHPRYFIGLLLVQISRTLGKLAFKIKLLECYMSSYNNNKEAVSTENDIGDLKPGKFCL